MVMAQDAAAGFMATAERAAALIPAVQHFRSATPLAPAQVKFPPGHYATWSGQFEYMERATERMKIVVPGTLAIIFVLLYFNFRCLTETLIVMLSVPFALAGVAAETGVVMLIYVDHAWQQESALVVRRASLADLHAAVMQGAVERVRPKMMTVTAIYAWVKGRKLR